LPYATTSPSYSSKNPFSALDLLNSRLSHAAAFIDPVDTTPQSVYDILYIVKQFGPETEFQSRLREVDASAACAAAGKHKMLVDLLTYLGVFGLTGISV
jgi:hypothetical protein